MAKKSQAGVAPVALRPALPRSARQATTKQKPSALVDTRVIYCGDNLEQIAKLPDGPCRTGHHWGETREKHACNSAFRNCIGRQLLLPLRLARQPLRQSHARPDFRRK